MTLAKSGVLDYVATYEAAAAVLLIISPNCFK